MRGLLDAATQAEWYDRARWYLSLPESDSVAVSVLEAMAHGMLPLLSDLPANRELVRDGDNGLIVGDSDGDGAVPVAACASVMNALEQATDELNFAWGKVTHLQSVADSPALREAHNAMLPKVTALFSKIPLNPELWKRLKQVSAEPATRALTGIHARLVEETNASFRAAIVIPDSLCQNLTKKTKHHMSYCLKGTMLHTHSSWGLMASTSHGMW